MPYIDLHTHSTFSDVTYTPNELIEAALKQRLAAIALTDHDTVEGIPYALEARKSLNIEVIAGIEFATSFKEKEIHIVGLFLDYKNSNLLKKIDEVQAAREERNIKMVKKLTDIGIPVSIDELKQASGGKIITRAHYAKVIVEKGFAADKNTAFKKFISPGLPGYVKRKFISPRECIETIINSGGTAVLAHPTLYNMDYTEITNLCKTFMQYGLTAIECQYSTYTYKQEKEIYRIAKKLGLKFSGGSDFHGKNKPDIHLGVGRGNLRIPYEYIENLKN